MYVCVCVCSVLANGSVCVALVVAILFFLHSVFLLKSLQCCHFRVSPDDIVVCFVVIVVVVVTVLHRCSVPLVAANFSHIEIKRESEREIVTKHSSLSMPSSVLLSDVQFLASSAQYMWHLIVDFVAFMVLKIPNASKKSRAKARERQRERERDENNIKRITNGWKSCSQRSAS